MEETVSFKKHMQKIGTSNKETEKYVILEKEAPHQNNCKIPMFPDHFATLPQICKTKL